MVRILDRRLDYIHHGTFAVSIIRIRPWASVVNLSGPFIQDAVSCARDGQVTVIPGRV
jgi:hypothetical protein